MCFAWATIIHLLIWAVAIGAALLILQLLLNFVLPKLSGVPMLPEIITLLVQVVKIVIWAIVIIFAIVIVAEIIGCLIGMAGGLPTFR